MLQDEKIKQQLIDTLYQGLIDEMNSAYQYIALAGKHGNGELKQAFLHYAQDELRHADRLMGILRDLGEEIQNLPIVQEDQEDVYLYLIEYMAKEESAVFYYEALEQLVAQPELQMLCRSMRGEEQMHLNQMRELYQKLKETAK